MSNQSQDIDFQEVSRFLNQFSEIQEAYLFGSRARNTHQKASDIDIAIVGEKITFRTISRLKGLLNEESSLPYFVDVVQFCKNQNEALYAEIERDKILIYQKK